MALIYVCGDPHGKFDHIIEAIESERPLATILLGDLDLKVPLQDALGNLPNPGEVWWVPGNHDTETDLGYDCLFGSAYGENNLHGRVVNIGGLAVAGLGGVFRSKIWSGGTARFQSPAEYTATCGKGNLWRGGLPLRHRSSIFPSDLVSFAGLSADLLITHEAPGAHRFGSSVLTELAANLKVSSAFHGHHHESIDYPDGVWHGVGLREIFKLRID
ncbi:metallophosphoesterase [Pseudoduganella sp.]|uniref:metallophosphoesterase family protein n=1 Tax=Pseudoduganella sp. TaxID=1880898 RepID=UPI0035B4D755